MYKEKESNREMIKTALNQFLEKVVFLIIIAHGIAHLVGFFIYWKLSPGTEDTPYKTKIFFSEIEISTLGVSILGFIYLILAILFVIIGILLFIKRIQFNDTIILVVLLFSLIITIIDLMPTIIGLFINIIYLTLFVVNKKVNII